MRLGDRVLGKFKLFLSENHKHSYDKESSSYVFGVYLDHNDTMCPYDIEEKINGGMSLLDLENYVYDNYLDNMTDEEVALVDDFMDYLESNDPSLHEEAIAHLRSDLKEILIHSSGLVFFNLNLNRILSEDIWVNIVLESEDSEDTEYSFNSSEALRDLDLYEEMMKEEIEYGASKEDFSLISLLESQGCSLSHLKNYRDNGVSGTNNFLESLLEETENVTSGCNSLVVQRKMNIYEYEDFLKKDKIKIDKDDTIGYVSFVYGAGSLLGIKLQRDFETKNFLIHLDGAYGYGIKDIYGDVH